SCEEGMRFNRRLVDRLCEPIRVIFEKAWLKCGWAAFEDSLLGPWSEIWVFGDERPFEAAPPGELMPRRWAVNHPASIGLRAPLPGETCIEVKGTWLSDAHCAPKEDRDNANRHHVLFKCGFA